MLNRLRFLGCIGLVLSTFSVGCGDDGDPSDDGSATGAGGAGGDGAGGGQAGADKDGDGHADLASGGDDCDDASAATFPGAPDTVGDGVDQSCDGLDGVDADEDGYASVESLGDDCNDAAASIHPGASDGGQLGQTTIFTADRPSQDPFVALTSDGAVHIGFTETYQIGNAVHQRPKLTSNASGIWQDQSFGEDGSVTGVAGSGTKVHLAYSRAPSGAVYATGDSGAAALTPTEVSPEGFVHGVAVDDRGMPYLGLRDGGYPLGTASVAALNGNMWELTSVESQAERTPVAIAVDGSGAAALLYRTSAGLMLARDDGSSFVAQVLATGDIGDRAALAIDHQGGAHVLFESNAELRYIGPGGTAETIPLDVSAAYAKLQLAVAPDGAVHMAVSQHSYGAHLFYGVLTQGGWTVHKLVSNDESFGNDAGIAVGTDGTVHFAVTGDYSVFHATIAAANGVDDDCDGEVW